MSKPDESQASRAAMARARAAKRAHASELLTKRNVVGVGVGLRQEGGARTDTVALVVMVSRKMPRAQLSPDDLLPSEIDGVPVDVQEVGELRALP